MLKRQNIILVLMILMVQGLFAQTTIDRPVAIVKLNKTEVISKKKLDYTVSIYEQQSRRKLSLDEKKQVLETLISQALVYQAAERDGVVVSDQQALQVGMNQFMQQVGQPINEDQYKKMIEAQTGQKFEVYNASIKKQLLLEKYVTEKKRDLLMAVKMPTEKEVEAFYKANESKFINPEMVKFSHIFFSTKDLDAAAKEEKFKKAQKVQKEIIAGNADFIQMVHENSEDQQSVARDGDIGTYVDRSEASINLFGQSFIDALFALKVDQVSSVLESPQGYHIVKLTSHLQKKFLGLDDPISPIQTQTVREYIQAMVGSQKQQAAFQKASNEIVTELNAEAEIQRFPDALQ